LKISLASSEQNGKSCWLVPRKPTRQVCTRILSGLPHGGAQRHHFQGRPDHDPSILVQFMASLWIPTHERRLGSMARRLET